MTAGKRAWDDVIPPLVKDRTTKPRTVGLTMVIDRCQGLSDTEDLLDLTADYVDHLKLSFGTSVLMAEGLLRRKIEIVRQCDIDVYPGGTLFETAFFQGVFPEFLSRARSLGFTAVEISDGTIELTPDQRADCIRRARDAGFKVITEVGKKDPRRQPPPGQIIEQVHADLNAGANLVIIEAREGGKGIGVYDARGEVVEDMLDILVDGLCNDLSAIMWEAPLKRQQAYLVQRFGPNVNLGNIKPRDVLGLETLRCGLRWETFRHYVE
jgi:phosphosulfolactate synthase